MESLMKATLTLIYEREVDEDLQAFLEEAVINKDEQAIMESFEIGWASPIQSTIIFSPSDTLDDSGPTKDMQFP
jgi:hypothetical protein